MDGAEGEDGMGLDELKEGMLPGMAEGSVMEGMTEEELRRLPMHTAERVLEKTPERYALAARLFFECGIGVRMICSMLKMSPHTLGAIIRAESGSKSAEEWRNEYQSGLKANLSLAANALGEMMLDKAELKKAGIVGISQVVDRLTRAYVMEQDAGLPKEEKEMESARVKTITAAAYVQQLEDKPDESIGG